MKKKITNNWDLKLLALLFSVILWLIVVNIDDPVKSVMFSGIDVKILNGDELEKQGQVYEILEDTGVVNVTVKGRRSVVEDISKENIKAVADMRDLTSMSTISIIVSTNKYANEIDDIRCDIPNVKLNIEPLKKIQKTISVEVVGTPENGYILGALSTNMNQVYLDGPESVINEVASVRAQLQVDNAVSNVSSSIPIKLYDAQGKVINDERIVMNFSVINVNQEILFTKYVPLRFDVTGTPPEGYAATGDIECDVNDIRIAGRKSVLDNIEAITVPGTVLNITGLTNDLETNVNLKEYLPGNVSLADADFNGMANIVVAIEREIFAEFAFSKEDIMVVNLPTGYSADVLTDGNYVTSADTVMKVYGLADIINEINTNNVRVVLDFNAYMREHGITEPEPGIYYLTPDFGFPEGAYVRDNFKVQIRINEN